MLLGLQDPSPKEKLIKLLREVQRRSDHFGKAIRVAAGGPEWLAVAWSAEPGEVESLVQLGKNQGYLAGPVTGHKVSFVGLVELTMPGGEYIASLETTTLPATSSGVREDQNHDPASRATSGSPDMGGGILPRRTVFVVHGHDDRRKEEVASFLRDLGLQPVILHQEANKGRTLIEKFEDHAGDVGFAVVVFTGDDEGRARPARDLPPKVMHHAIKCPPPWRLRARQNVVLELGFFLGRLGREKVCVLHEREVEHPSDYDGVVYVSLDRDWREELHRELVAAGLPVTPPEAKL